jgi:hypothetical protein
MFEPCRDARKRMSELASDAASEFETTMLHNRVYEGVQGQHDKNSDLARLLDLTERTYDLAADRDEQGDRLDIFGAAEDLNDKVGDVVDEQVAMACAEVHQEASDRSDDEEKIDEAQAEAWAWLVHHEDAAERADVAEEVLADA